MMDLKAILLSLFVVTLSLFGITHAVTHAEMDQLAVACNGQKADIDVMKQWRVPSSDSGKCLMKCLTDYYKMFDSEGKYSLKNTEDSLYKAWSEKPKEHMPIIAQHCDNMMRSAPKENLGSCQMSYDTMKCINEKAWELGWFN
uniref:SP19.1 n=2 Tax=Bemisia tabaci TaxID=7038 RepID=A0A7S5LJZ9_BEMTA|nr:PREDICTED: uncharacterized protein LOC109029981 [Bemisia tabaci]QHB15698.1 SP19.1 [Bemisia tabaci]